MSGLDSHLNPGGYIELQDILFPTRSFDPVKTDDYKLIKYFRAMADGMNKMGFDFHAPAKFSSLLKSSGFDNVQIKWTNVPVGSWAKGARNKLMGQLEVENFAGGLEMAKPMFQALGMSNDEIYDLINGTRAELLKTEVLQYLPICYAYARKLDDQGR
jgi:hypothetical protein